MNDLSLALIRKGKGTGVVAGTTNHDLELALARRYGDEAPVPVLTTFLTFSSADPFTLGRTGSPKGWDGTLAYSFDGTTWTRWNGGTIASQTVNGQDQILVGGYGNHYLNTHSDPFTISGTSVACTGDIRSLLDYKKTELGEDSPMGHHCYSGLFSGCTALVSAPDLPSTALTEGCYYMLFDGCSNLQTAPTLPATTLAEACYAYMFHDCEKLSSAPALPATTLKHHCYSRMFSGCTALKNPPAISATTLASECCSSMFAGSGLITAPTLLATTLAPHCYERMFYSCSFLSTAPSLPATTLALGCYGSMFLGCLSLETPPALPATTLAEECYGSMFAGSSLKASPALPATTLAKECYRSMFSSCTQLKSIPALPATTLAEECYRGMFSHSGPKFATASSSTYPNAYRIPTTGTGTTATDALTDMFSFTGGSFEGTPSINTTYYTDATIVPAA